MKPHSPSNPKSPGKSTFGPLIPSQQFAAALHLLVHELCSPLQSLVASNEALATQALDPDGRRALARIHRATQKITTQLNDLEALAQVHSGAAHAKPASFEVGALMEDIAAADQLRNSNSLSRVDVRVPPAPIFVKGEAQFIQQALDRLVRTVLDRLGGKVILSVDTPSAEAGRLSLRLQCEVSGPSTDSLADRLDVVQLIASAFDGELSMSNDHPAGPTFDLRVSVHMEDPDAVPERPA